MLHSIKDLENWLEKHGKILESKVEILGFSPLGVPDRPLVRAGQERQDQDKGRQMVPACTFTFTSTNMCTTPSSGRIRCRKLNLDKRLYKKIIELLKFL